MLFCSSRPWHSFVGPRRFFLRVRTFTLSDSSLMTLMVVVVVVVVVLLIEVSVTQVKDPFHSLQLLLAHSVSESIMCVVPSVDGH